MAKKTPIYALDHFHEAAPDPLTAGFDAMTAARKEEFEREEEREAVSGADGNFDWIKTFPTAAVGNCLNCGGEFGIPSNLFRRSRLKKKYCSDACGKSYRQRVRRRQRELAPEAAAGATQMAGRAQDGVVSRAEGYTLRDHFALACLRNSADEIDGFAGKQCGPDVAAGRLADFAYRFADAMLERRKK